MAWLFILSSFLNSLPRKERAVFIIINIMMMMMMFMSWAVCAAMKNVQICPRLFLYYSGSFRRWSVCKCEHTSNDEEKKRKSSDEYTTHIYHLFIMSVSVCRHDTMTFQYNFNFRYYSFGLLLKHQVIISYHLL